ncbi:MAG: putative metal-dependent hydrolase [Acidobacteria bacterium]|nr:putative metal-dependent hydrolase [Acidobacteriota bacterium]
MLEKLKYPIGRVEIPAEINESRRKTFIKDIADMPELLKEAVKGLNEEQLNNPYRPDGWTLRQVVHHLADSHLNSYIRFKMALTENEPTIKTYFEDRWADLADSKASIEPSLNLIDALHTRWVILLKSLSDKDFERAFRHPDLGLVTLNKALAIYAWHGKHHLAHITCLRDSKGWV